MAFLLKYRFVFIACIFLMLVTPLAAQKKNDNPQIRQQLIKAKEYLDKSPDTCIIICDQGLALLAPDDQFHAASFHSLKGFALEHLGRFTEALREQNFPLQYALKRQDNGAVANCYNNLGVIYDYMGKLDSALVFYHKAYTLFKKAKDQKGLNLTTGNLGLAYLNKGNFKRSIDYLFEARKISVASHDSAALSACLTNLGLAYDKQGNTKKALEYYISSSHIDSLLHDSLNLALSYNNIGSIYFEQKDFNKAEIYHQRALEIRQRANYMQGVSESYHNLASVYETKREWARAKEYFEKSVAISETIGDTYGLMMGTMDLGSFYTQQKEYDKAIAYLQKALAYSKSQGGYADEYKIYLRLSEAYSGKGNYEQAYKAYLHYSEVSDSVKSYGNSKKLTELELQSAFEKKQQEDAFKNKQRQIKLDAEKKRDRIIKWALIIGISLLLLVVIIVFRGYRNKQKANRQLQQQNDVITNQHREIQEQKNIIEEKNRDITDSIQYAQRLQHAILPPHHVLSRHLQYFILYRPKDIVSGDFYWAQETTQGFLFAVVDCTGHGVPGSMVSIIANNALNRAVNEFKLYQPAAILNKVTELVEEYFNKNVDEDEIRDGMDISLCLLQASGKLEFAGANNSLIIVRAGAKHIEELKADKQPIGHYEHRKPYQNHSTQLAKGDMLYLYTDGYADQFGGEQGKKFKSSRLKEELLGMHTRPLEEQKHHLEHTLDQWTDGYEQNDDICLMGVRIA